MLHSPCAGSGSRLAHKRSASAAVHVGPCCPRATARAAHAAVCPQPLAAQPRQPRPQQPGRLPPLAAVVADRAGSAAAPGAERAQRSLRVIIAGAGIGGLVLAVALLKKGVQVAVYERDLTAIRGEGKYRGPIQVQSNALAALEAIDAGIADEVLKAGCITGDRINGLCDGETGDWYIKFDTFHPAVSRGLPVTRVISRVTLQEILADAVVRLGGPGVIQNSANVVGFEEYAEPGTGAGRVRVTLEDGRTDSGDLLIGADGIWSKVRRELMGESAATYSGYTCYTGISDFTPPDLEIVGYRVFLGNGQYFVSSDVGGGKQQWYGFHKEPADGSDPPGQSRKQRLLDIFGHWCDDVTDLIKATPEEDILRRDIYDRPPIFSWSKGRVALLGDSAHAMQPNLGQGGCMAIEDGFQLGLDLAEALRKAGGDPDKLDVRGLWGSYEGGRLVRAAAIHGMARFAAIMASTYKAYLGEGLGPLEFIKSWHIPHPGRVGGRAILHATMPAVLSWVLGGFNSHLERVRPSACRLQDRLKVFSEDDFATFMRDDEQLLRAAHARWMLLSERPPSCASADATSCAEAKGIYMGEAPAVVGGATQEPGAAGNGASGGSGAPGIDLLVADARVAAEHARVWRDAAGDCWVQDLPSSSGTWLNGRLLVRGEKHRLAPQDVLEFGSTPSPEPFRVKLQHVSLPQLLDGHAYSLIPVGGAARLAQAQAGGGALASPVAA